MIMFHVKLPGCKYFACSSLPGEMIQFDYSNIFQRGCWKPPSNFAGAFSGVLQASQKNEILFTEVFCSNDTKLPTSMNRSGVGSSWVLFLFCQDAQVMIKNMKHKSVLFECWLTAAFWIPQNSCCFVLPITSDDRLYWSNMIGNIWTKKPSWFTKSTHLPNYIKWTNVKDFITSFSCIFWKFVDFSRAEVKHIAEYHEKRLETEPGNNDATRRWMVWMDSSSSSINSMAISFCWTWNVARMPKYKT